jgi:uncharacterized membrane protein
MPEAKTKPLGKNVVKSGEGHKVVGSVVINRPVHELYRFWRQLENLPQVMRNLESVTQISEVESHWVAKSPMGKKIEWSALIFNEHPNELIAWRSREDAELPNAGSVRFTSTAAGGTEVTVQLEYDPPAGEFGAALARLVGDAPEQQLDEDLQNFKRFMESRGAPVNA